MSAATFFTYVWHYVVVRLLYEQMLRPLLNGHPAAFLVAAAAAVVIMVALRRQSR